MQPVRFPKEEDRPYAPRPEIKPHPKMRDKDLKTY